jgi:1-acyl-sn-glycerol-3-phosphate acyltransferase
VAEDETTETGLSAARTTELALEDMRAHLPGLEPDRQVTDWGRSERVEATLDGTLFHFLYHYWFRVVVEGIENVPADGPALLVANQAGAIVPSAAMVVKAVRHRHPRARPVHFVTDPKLNDLPAIGMLVTKVGGIPNHPANVKRLLFDEGELVLAFPEATAKPTKPIKDRYRLRPFGEDRAIATALGAGAPIVPVALIGAEEAFPVVARLPGIRLAPPFPLPARFRIRFLEPVRASENGDQAAQRLAHDIRALVQENLIEMLSERRSVWLG